MEAIGKPGSVKVKKNMDNLKESQIIAVCGYAVSRYPRIYDETQETLYYFLIDLEREITKAIGDQNSWKVFAYADCSVGISNANCVKYVILSFGNLIIEVYLD